MEVLHTGFDLDVAALGAAFLADSFSAVRGLAADSALVREAALFGGRGLAVGSALAALAAALCVCASSEAAFLPAFAALAGDGLEGLPGALIAGGSLTTGKGIGDGGATGAGDAAVFTGSGGMGLSLA